MKTKNFPGHKFARQQAAFARAIDHVSVTAKDVRAMDMHTMHPTRSIRTKKDRRSLNQI